MNDSSSSRRSFLKTATIGGAFAAAGGVAHSADGAERRGGGRSNDSGLIDAREHGAVGDGKSDDTEALQDAIRRAAEAGASGVFLPAGVYRVSDAVRLPSNFRLAGAGKGLTILQAVPETIFPKVRPDPRTADIRQRRTLLTTGSAGTTREEVVENVLVEGMTIDWNHCPTERFGHSVILMDSVDRGIIRDVAFINCLPSDHPPSRGEELRGSIFRGECVLYSNARDGLMDRCRLTDSGYRPLSVSYGSLGIVFRNGVIHAEKPVWRHAFSENHGDGLPRDETFVNSQLIFLNSEFILEGGEPSDGVCSHTGTTHVENCDFRIRGGTTTLSWIIRAFDGSRTCTYIHNRFHCEGDFERSFAIVGTSPRTGQDREDNQSIIVEGNHVHASFNDKTGGRPAALFRFPAGDRRVKISGNQVNIRRAGENHPPIIHAKDARNLVISGNSIESEAPGRNGPPIILLENCRSVSVIGNTATGDYSRGLEIAGLSRTIAESGNAFAGAADEEIRVE